MANKPGWRIGSVRGVPIYVGRSWLFISVLIVAMFGPQVRHVLPELGGLAYLVAVAYVVGLLVSVLVHEVAHALAGQWRGYAVQQIVADLWGGHTAFSREGATPLSSAIVAGVGPLSNAALAFVAFLALQTDVAGVPALLLSAFTWANAFVAAFNLLPGLPLDGGYLLEALVWRLTGSRTRGTEAAGWTGRLLTVLIVVATVAVPLVRGHRPDLLTVAWVALIGSFLWAGAGAAVQRARVNRRLAKVPLRSVLRPLGEADRGTTLDRLPPTDTLVRDHGKPFGLAYAGAAMQVPIEQRGTTPVDAVTVRPDGPWVLVVTDPDAGLDGLLASIEASGMALRTVVLDADGRSLGWLAEADLVDAVQRVLGTPG